MKQDLEAIIGLEIHIHLDTQTKMFCGTINSESEESNVYTCPICLGHPGTLPQLNEEAVRLGSLLGLAVGADVQLEQKFDRKNYFYPDLPKGYQISQYDKPLAWGGSIQVQSETGELRTIGIERLHLEEDTAKLKHAADGTTLADFNRAGAPLVELVSKPDMRTPQEAKAFVQALQQLCRYIGASRADLEKAHMRCDVNVSLRPVGDEALYPKTEVKNLNSFRAIERACAYEIARQTQLWEDGNAPELTTTRGWDDAKGETVHQRTKEGQADYRFFPEPDLPPLIRTREDIEALRVHLPELPAARRDRFRAEYQLSFDDADLLIRDPRIGELYEDTISELRAWTQVMEGDDPIDQRWEKHSQELCRATVNLFHSGILKLLKATGKDIADIQWTAENLAESATVLYTNKINSSAGQKILSYMFEHGGDPTVIMKEHDLEQVSDSAAVEMIVDQILMNNAESVEDYKNGKDRALQYLVGQVMKETKGKMNPQMATALLQEKIQQS